MADSPQSVPVLKETEWSFGFAYDIALSWDDPRDVCEKWGVTFEEYDRLKDFEPFQKVVARIQKEISADGDHDRLIAQSMVTNGLKVVYNVMHDIESPPDVKLKAFDRIMELSGKKGQALAQSGVAGFNLQITLPEVANNPAKNVGPVAEGLPVITVEPDSE